MLKYIKIRNFLSIRDEIELNFESTNRGNKKGNVFNVNGNTISRSTIIYGANASGKTNIFKATSFIIFFIYNSHNRNFLRFLTPFLLDENSLEKSSSFELYISNNIGNFRYIVELNSSEIIREELYKTTKSSKREDTIFTRKGKHIEPGKSNIGELFKKEIEKGYDKVRPDSLLVSVLSQWNGKLLDNPIMDIFNNINVMIGDTPRGLNLRLLNLQKDENKKELVIEFLKSADINIDDIRITKKDISEDTIKGNVQIEEIPDFILDNLSLEVEFGHKNENGEMIYFKLQNESDGTQRLFNLLGPMIDTIINGGILFVDEIERNLHIHILKNLFKLIHNKDLKTNFQFIFTTHNIELLDLNIFKKEQIGIVNKGDGVSTTYDTLYDYDIRSENDIKKMYDNGAFGGIPYMKDFSSLFSNLGGGEKNEKNQ